MDSGTGGVHGTVFGGRKGEKLTKASADLEGNLKTLRDKACQRPRRRKVPPAKNAAMHSCGDECHAVSQCVFVAKGAGHGYGCRDRGDWTCGMSHVPFRDRRGKRGAASTWIKRARSTRGLHERRCHLPPLGHTRRRRHAHVCSGRALLCSVVPLQLHSGRRPRPRALCALGASRKSDAHCWCAPPLRHRRHAVATVTVGQYPQSRVHVTLGQGEGCIESHMAFPTG